MSQRAAPLVMSLVVVLLLSTAGCIEVKEKPPQGPFTIEVEAEEMYFVDEAGGHLEGPHAHVETEIAHVHEGYAWEIEDLGEFEGAEVELPAHDVGVRKASYNIHFLDQENHTGLSVATVPDLSGIYFVIGDGIGLEHGDHSDQTLDLEVTPGSNLTEVSSHEGWTILEYAGRLSDPMVVKLVHDNNNVGTVTYLVGTHVKSGEVLEEDVGSLRIMAGETHYLSFVEGELTVTIWAPEYDDAIDDPIFNGTYDELPKEYRTHIGKLEWEGHVGEVEESPGFGSLLAVTAVVIALVVVRSRRP